MKQLIVVAAVLCSVMPVPALCQEDAPPPPKANFSGVLVDPQTGLAPVGVKLSLVEPGEHFAVTGAEGRFSFRDIPAGTYHYLFAYERGDTTPAGSILLRKNINVEPGEADAGKIEHRALLERPEDTKPPMKTFEFADRRERDNYNAIVMNEVVGAEWPEEYVSLQISFAAYSCREPSLRIADGSTGQEVPFQISAPRYAKGDSLRSCSVTFPALLKPFERKVYAACSDWREGFQAPEYPSDLKVETREETGEQILSNSLIAVRLPPASGTKPLAAADCPAPILAVRGPDGVWFGKGSFVSERTVKSFKCEETEKGPIFKEFKVTYTFASAEGAEEAKDAEERPAEYHITIRLYARRDYVMISETMIGDVDLSFRLSLRENFNPDVALFAGNGAARFGVVPAEPPGGKSTLAVFRAWNPPGIRKSHNWYGITSSGGRKDAIGIMQVNGGRWQFVARNQWGDGSWMVNADDKDEVRLIATGGPGLYLDFPHRLGTRIFALALFDKTRNWDPAALAAQKPAGSHTHYLNRLHVQLSQLGLTGLLDAKADRAGAHERPRLLFNAQTFPALQKLFEKDPGRFPVVLHDVFTGSRTHTTLARTQIMGSVALLRDALVGSWNEREISGFSGRRADPTLLEPLIKYAALLYDAHSSSGIFSEREKETILAILALAAAQLEHPNQLPTLQHDPEAAASRDSAITMIALLLDEHPKSSSRILDAKQRLLTSLYMTAATGGIDLETGPAMRSLNIWAEMAPLFENTAGVIQMATSPFTLPEFVNALARLATFTTPPDRRYGGTRLMPTIGSSVVSDAEPLAVTGVGAAKFAGSAPELAGRLAWVWDQADKPVFRPGARHRTLLNILDLDKPPAVEPKAAEKADSVYLPGFGVLMRTRFGQPDEAYLLFKCSPRANSHHHDQGSLLFYAFGAPLLVDPPSPPRRQGAWAHNTVRIGARSCRAPGRIVQFAEQDQDNYAVGEIRAEALSELKEYTKAELDGLAAAAAKEKKPFVLPPGHLRDGSQTAEMMAASQKLEKPVHITRHVLFNKTYQYLVVYDRIKGYEATDVFYNVFADQARIEGRTVTFAGPFGVDLTVHAFGPENLKIGLHKDTSQRWTLRLSQPAPPRPAKAKTEKSGAAAKEAVEEEEDSEPPTTEYFTVLCPSRRRLPGETDVVERAAAKVESLEGLRAVRISHGKTVRYIFLSHKEIEYKHGGLTFKGTRGIVTIRPTHFGIALFDAGEVRYNGRGVKTSHGMVRFTVAPGGFVSGETSGPEEKRLTFYELGRSAGSVSYRVDGMEFLGDGSSRAAIYGVTGGFHTVTVKPK
ncbi:MAG: hypothetical protein ABIF82_10715 [Planctomycetota bacterium]